MQLLTELLKSHRMAVALQTSKLQQENSALKARMAELEGANRGLAREAYSWRTRYEQLAQHAGLPSSQHLQPPQQSPQQQPHGSFVSPGSDRRVGSSHSATSPHIILGGSCLHCLLAQSRLKVAIHNGLA